MEWSQEFTEVSFQFLECPLLLLAPLLGRVCLYGVRWIIWHHSGISRDRKTRSSNPCSILPSSNPCSILHHHWSLLWTSCSRQCAGLMAFETPATGVYGPGHSSLHSGFCLSTNPINISAFSALRHARASGSSEGHIQVMGGWETLPQVKLSTYL